MSIQEPSPLRQHSLSDLLRRTARRMPDKIAIRCGDVQWTYAEFDLVCSRLAQGLRDRKIGSGDRVAILSRNSHAFAAMRFALARAYRRSGRAADADREQAKFRELDRLVRTQRNGAQSVGGIEMDRANTPGTTSPQ